MIPTPVGEKGGYQPPFSFLATTGPVYPRSVRVIYYEVILKVRTSASLDIPSSSFSLPSFQQEYRLPVAQCQPDNVRH